MLPQNKPDRIRSVVNNQEPCQSHSVEDDLRRMSVGRYAGSRYGAEVPVALVAAAMVDRAVELFLAQVRLHY